jgi:quercetin dioxygenase-like cupin family protein
MNIEMNVTYGKGFLPEVPNREQINRLQKEMVKMPQADLKTDHYFSGGLYCRKVFRPAGTLIVGKIHKEDHIFLCASGQIMVWTEGGMKTLNAGDVIESKAGTKRVTLALTDAIGVTIHKTDEKDLEIIEKQLIEPDNLALFDYKNELKKFIIENKENIL